MATVKGEIFDLDGVIVDTAKYHFKAWKRLADELQIPFTEEDNERLKGVSRVRSLEIILEIGGVEKSADEFQELMKKKNDWYVEMISHLDESEILPGAKEYLLQSRAEGKKIALGSASKNAVMILEGLGIIDLFDAIIDGNKVSKAKPDPEVFLKAADELGLKPEDCVVFEDAEAGVEAGRAGGMYVIGIGNPLILQEANRVVSGLDKLVHS
ncbi:beta-phosphoglucomutase [Listeria floridensis FSL S10-1187]|uniref:Beta-phosphoglucomutase n=1 Tax=Listeria floridensis FSL S10-1187 TaxID=1265817 RepID=A0ABP3B189_9LIST|nr:beta-phosphoglucomutase [Listeria floridensis]EUJ33699.1 beta-phosphoglucomutase [Listeria floridensis FSL S10-1187]